MGALVVLGGCDLGAPAVNFVGPGHNLVAGDVNGDGNDDVVAVGQDGYAVLVADGEGGFTQSVVADHPAGLLDLGDVDEDGNLDLVETEGFEDSPFHVRYGGGDGTFGAVVAVEAAHEHGPVDLDLGDVDGDGHLDIVTIDTRGVKVRSGDGTGGFGPPALYTRFASGFESTHLVDVDTDGDLDLIGAGTRAGDPHVTVVLNGGDGFVSHVEHPIDIVYDHLGDVVAVDVDTDGDLDLVTSDLSLPAYVVLLGDGTGAFVPQAPVTHPADQPLYRLAVADIDADGHDDLVASTGASTTGYVLFGDGVGGFPALHKLSTGDQGAVRSVVAADVDDDGRPDVVFGHGAVGAEVENVTVMVNRLDDRPSG